MLPKPLKTKEAQPVRAATHRRPSPADFPLGSAASRAAARAMLQQLAENDGPQPGDIWIDLTFLTLERATEICRVSRALREESVSRGWDRIPPQPDSPRMWIKWPEGFDPDAAFESDPPLTMKQVTDDDLRDVLRFYHDAFRKAKDDGVPLPPSLDPDLEWNGMSYVPAKKTE
jgi:hypothetical protein